MKKIISLIAFASALTLSGCGLRTQQSNLPKYIKVFEQERRNSHTSALLRTFLAQTPAPSVLVRNLWTSSNDVAANSNTATIVSMLETQLARSDFDVRDRSLFSSVMDAAGKNAAINYEELHKQTNVDLIFEITGLSLNDEYYVDKYWVGNQSFKLPGETVMVGKRAVVQDASYILRGMSVQIKVILLKDNVMGGSYDYSYVPCSDELGGGIIKTLNPLVYTPPTGGRDIGAILNDPRSSQLIQSRSERMEKVMSDFLETTVIPKIIADMKGTTYETPYEVAARQKAAADERIAALKAAADKNQPRLEENRKQQTSSTEHGAASAQTIAPVSNPNAKSVNSVEKLAPTVSNLINQLFVKRKGAKKAAKLTSEIKRMSELKGDEQDEVDKFIVTSCTTVGAASEAEDSVIFLVAPNAANPYGRDLGIVLFIDDECVGVGTIKKGLYSQLPIERFSSGFHTVTITSVKGKEIFSSSVDFSIKNNFSFLRNINGRTILE